MSFSSIVAYLKSSIINKEYTYVNDEREQWVVAISSCCFIPKLLDVQIFDRNEGLK